MENPSSQILELQERFWNGYGFCFREQAPKYDDKFYDAVRPIYDYLNSGEYVAFTPYAAKKIVPGYFNHTLKEVFYKYYENVDLKHDVPMVILVPKSEVDPDIISDLILIAESVSYTHLTLPTNREV